MKERLNKMLKRSLKNYFAKTWIPKAFILFGGLLFSLCVYAANPTVEMKTNMGKITLELDPNKAPATVANFLKYVRDGFYRGTIFHRVIPNFMIQGGGFAKDYVQKPAGEPIENEAANGLANDIGSIAMARTSDPHSATAQFFINVANNEFLNYRSPSVSGFGYCVFGKVIKGMDVVNSITALPTGPSGPFPTDAPQKQVVITEVTVIDTSKSEGK